MSRPAVLWQAEAGIKGVVPGLATDLYLREQLSYVRYDSCLHFKSILKTLTPTADPPGLKWEEQNGLITSIEHGRVVCKF